MTPSVANPLPTSGNQRDQLSEQIGSLLQSLYTVLEQRNEQSGNTSGDTATSTLAQSSFSYEAQGYDYHHTKASGYSPENQTSIIFTSLILTWIVDTLNLDWSISENDLTSTGFQQMQLILSHYLTRQLLRTYLSG